MSRVDTFSLQVEEREDDDDSVTQRMRGQGWYVYGDGWGCGTADGACEAMLTIGEFCQTSYRWMTSQWGV